MIKTGTYVPVLPRYVDDWKRMAAIRSRRAVTPEKGPWSRPTDSETHPYRSIRIQKHDGEPI